MNIKNNKRRQATRESIESIFMTLLQTREISEITVSDICKRTGLNRSTFYANYQDLYDLADQIRDRLEKEVEALYDNDLYNNCGIDYLRLFHHIKDNQLFYISYFKLGYDSRHVADLRSISRQQIDFPEENLEYHVAFHKAGLNAIIKKWLSAGCDQSPEAMVKIIREEYTNRR